jgi:hypothetical protein
MIKTNKPKYDYQARLRKREGFGVSTTTPLGLKHIGPFYLMDGNYRSLGLALSGLCFRVWWTVPMGEYRGMDGYQ